MKAVIIDVFLQVVSLFASVCLCSDISNHIEMSLSLSGGSKIRSQEIDAKRQLEEIQYKRVRYQPRHVHLSYADKRTSMMVTWSTVDNPNGSFVEFGRENIGERRMEGWSEVFVSLGPNNLKQWIHRVKLKGLVPGAIYIYHCGSDLGWSELFFFRATRNGTDWSPQLAVFGDLGNVNAKTLTRLQRETQLQYYDAILHVGDFAYDLQSEEGLVGDSFMDQIQPVAAYVPYMTCPGNHEYFKGDYLQYKKRFSMPGSTESMYFSWNMGPVHFISFSTEYYYQRALGYEPLTSQYDWLVADLEEATKVENRNKRPWIVTFGHRPMYCSNLNGGDCNSMYCYVRDGLFSPLHQTYMYGLEDVFMKYGVDLAIWAHEHSYERLWPIYKLVVRNGSLEQPYKNPKALVHVTTGSAGCSERHDPFSTDQPDWSAFRSTDYGYSRIRVANRTHLYLEQLSEDQGGKIIDSFWLIRENHKPYSKIMT